MTVLNNPHDRFFKAVFGRAEVAAEFLVRYLPAGVAREMDWTTLRAAKDSFLDPELAGHPADLLYAVELRGGGPAYVQVLFEHKSYVEARINLDLLRYRVRIWEQWRKAGNAGPLPIIIPVVVYHGATTWQVSRQFADGVVEAPALREFVPVCVYHLMDVSAYPDEELRGAVMLHTALLTLKYIFRNELRERLPGILGLLRSLEQSSSGLDYVTTLLRYLAQGAKADRLTAAELRQTVAATLTGGGDLMMTIAEQWIQEGRREGRQEGRQEGRREGHQAGLTSERQLLLRQVRRRFGPVVGERSQMLLARIAEPAVLEELGEELLDCADGEAWLAALARRITP